MKDERYEDLNREIQRFLSDKKSLISKISISTLKKSRNRMKEILSETNSEFIDPVSYKEILNTKINTIYANIEQDVRSVSVKPRNGLFTYNDIFNIIIKFIEKDMKKMLSEKYFIEAKKYKNFSKKDKNNTIYHNMMEIIKIREDIVNTYLIFILSFYKKLPLIINGMKERNEMK